MGRISATETTVNIIRNRTMSEVDYLSHLTTIFWHLDILSKLPEKQAELEPIRTQFKELIAEIIKEES
jgi:hypothetical protein